MSTHTNCAVLSPTNTDEDTVRCVYRLHLSPLWDEILTLAYMCEANLIVDQKYFRRYPQSSMFTSTGGLTDVPLLFMGYSVEVVGQ
jgi:hypothetical protein